VDPGYAYNEFSRFKLYQSYDFNKASNDDPEPFSPVYGELEVRPHEALSLSGNAGWSQYDGAFESHDLLLRLSDDRGDQLRAEHRYTRDVSESVAGALTIKVSEPLSLFADYERNLHDKKDIKTGVGLLYEAACWSIDFRYTEEETDQRWSFMVNLSGLGGVGSDISGN
jgi:LPS-assembly protein